MSTQLGNRLAKSFMQGITQQTGVQWMEHLAVPVPPVYEVRSTIDIQAPPQRVWKQVVAFTEIPPPKEWMFRAGIAYPIRAELLGNGPGAERHCVFSPGAFSRTHRSLGRAEKAEVLRNVDPRADAGMDALLSRRT